MKIFLTGAEGQLGRELQRRLKGTDYLATDLKELDITDETAVFNTVSKYKPAAVIHCAAYTRVDEAEKESDLAFKINAIGTQNIAIACRMTGAKMVYISTDYVFDGRLNRAYTEADDPNPLSVYGKTKYRGEILSRQAMSRLFTIRTAWLYGDGPNFVRTMLKKGQEQNQIQVVNDQYGCPTSTVDLTEAILRLVQTEQYGTYHAVNTGVTNWYGFAKKIFDLAGNSGIHVMPVSTSQYARPATRPAYSPLDTRLLFLALGWRMRPWEEALEEYLKGEVMF